MGRLRVIFKLPDTIRNWHLAPQAWPTEHLAYVEWFKMSAGPGASHNMYTVNRPERVEGAIVPLVTIRQSCQLIPLIDRPKHEDNSWPETWNSGNVLDESTFFLLNNWTSKYSYQTIY